MNGIPWPPGLGSFDLPALVPSLGPAVTKYTLMVWLAVALVLGFFLVANRRPRIVPTRGQWLAESVYGLVRDGICRETIGVEGIRFAPYLTSLLCFLALTNIFGIVPFLQLSPNAHIAFPALLAVISYVLYFWVGFRRQGVVGYLRNNILPPPGVPLWIYPLIIPIEVLMQFVTRPFTLAVRLFANMFAGHIVLLVFTLGGFTLFAANNVFLYGVGALSLVMAIVLTLFEAVVALLQAYVFVMLTASYLQGSLEGAH